MDIMEGQQKDARIAELERKLSAALGAVDFWQTAHEQAEAELAARDRMLGFINPWRSQENRDKWLTHLRARAEEGRRPCPHGETHICNTCGFVVAEDGIHLTSPGRAEE